MTEIATQNVESTDLPEWALQELRELAEIEPQLFPSPDFVGQYRHHDLPVARDIGDLYANCFERLSGFMPDLIIIVPWLVPGGADQGVLHHVEAGISQGKRVLVIGTLSTESPWRERLPEAARFLVLGQLGAHLSEDQRLVVLTRLVLQLQAPVLHVINSQLGWEMVKRHGKSLIDVGVRIYASLFCEDIDEYGKRWGYAISYLTDCWPYLKAVFFDSSWYRKLLMERYGCAEEKMFTVYFPALIAHKPAYLSASSNKVIWAGRLTAQKRPDLLAEIARYLPEVSFDVYGYASNEADRAFETQLRQVTNVTLHGTFDSLMSVIEKNNYALLLYTSGWDGLPLILLDATAAGMPIVASAVGGVPDFIGEETGYPVWDVNEPRAYVKRIQEAIADSEERRRRWDAAADLLLSRHSAEAFRLRLKDIPGYFTEKISEPEAHSVSE